MGTTLNITTAGQYSEGTSPITIGSTTVPVQLTYSSGLVAQRPLSLSTASSGVLLTIGSGADIPSMDACIITSDQEVGIQLEGSSAANNSTFRLAAGKFVVLTDGQIYTYAAAGDFGSTVLVDIATIRARNDSGSTATVKIWAFT